MKERTAETAAAIIALLVFWAPSLAAVIVGIDVLSVMEYPPDMFELAACLLALFAVPVLLMKRSLEWFLVIMEKKEMNYRVIWPVAWIIMNLWLMLIVVLVDNQIPRRLSIDVLAISGVSVMVALCLLHKELQKMFK